MWVTIIYMFSYIWQALMIFFLFFFLYFCQARGSVKHISLQDIQAVKRDHSSKGFQFEIITQHKMETFVSSRLRFDLFESCYFFHHTS